VTSHSELNTAGMSPLREVWTIAWPTVLTMTSYTIMQFTDKLMVAQVGPSEFTAQSNGGIWAFNALSFCMGVVTVINTYVSQNLGAGRPENGPKYAWAGFWLSAIVWVSVLIPFALFIPMIFASLPNHSAELQRMEVGYAQILLVGGVVLLLSRAMNNYFFGMHRPKIITIAAIIGNLVNVVGNYILIYGDQGVRFEIAGTVYDLPGMPGVAPLGVYGAAIATVVGTVIELFIPTIVFLGKEFNTKYHTRAQWRPNFRAIGELLKIGWPAALQWGNELVCWSLFMTYFVGHFGEPHMAGGWIALSFMHLSFMPSIGFSVAVTSLVGKYIGAGQPDVAESRAYLGLRLTVIYMSVCGLIFFLFRHSLAGVFVGADVPPDQAAQIIKIGGTLLICAAVFQTFDAFGIVFTGALRGAGDTLWPGMMTVIYSWVFIVFGGWLFIRFAPGLESIGPWIAASIYIILFGMTVWWRFATGRWRSISLLDRQSKCSSCGYSLAKIDSEGCPECGAAMAQVHELPTAVPVPFDPKIRLRDIAEPIAANDAGKSTRS
jgi:multidrug resistance protein, MATE family